jgi:drug/metabolite transporter (DMT)-like permease
MLWFWLAFASALMSAMASIAEKKVLFRMDALNFSWTLSLFTLVLSLPLFLFIDYAKVTPLALAVLFGKNILGAFAFYFVMQSIRRLELSAALPMMTLTPGLTALLAWPLLGEALNAREIAGMLLLLAGTYLIETVRGASLLHPFTVFFRSDKHRSIVAALLLFTATSILDKVLLTDLAMGPLSLMAFQHVFTPVVFLVFILASGRKPVAAAAFPREALLWIAAVAVLTLGYRFTQFEAVYLAPVALVLAVKRVSVFIAAMAGGKLFDESRLGRKAVAILLLLAGATLVVGL